MDNEWIESMKKIVLQAVEAGKPCDIYLGTVSGVSPPAVKIDQRTTFSGPQLLIPENLTDHTVQMVVPQLGEVSVTVKNALKTGDQVILIQKRGAQQYLVADRY